MLPDIENIAVVYLNYSYSPCNRFYGRYCKIVYLINKFSPPLAAEYELERIIDRGAIVCIRNGQYLHIFDEIVNLVTNYPLEIRYIRKIVNSPYNIEIDVKFLIATEISEIEYNYVYDNDMLFSFYKNA